VPAVSIYGAGVHTWEITMPADRHVEPDASQNAGLSSLRSEKYLRALRDTPALTAAEERQLLVDYRNGNAAAGERVVLANMRGVVFMAWKFKGYGLPIEDLVQEGFIGMAKALPRFDPDCNVRFMTYALHWVREALYEYVLRNYRIVRPVTTKEQHKLFFSLRRRRKHSGALHVGEADALAREMGVDEESIRKAVSFFASDVPLDHLSPAVHSSEDVLVSDGASPEALVESSDWNSHVAIRLKSALSALPSRSREILCSRVLSERNDRHGLKALGDRYGISAERIRQVEQQAYTQLRKQLLSDDGQDLRYAVPVHPASAGQALGATA
jgi:RNA polymerase sigma-32 factor